MTILGIRHHGPGCARSLIAALNDLRPDCILVEGPPEADGLIPQVVSVEMKPPVAILIHQVDEPSNSSFYPFAEYSPEWQALKWAVSHETPVRFFDLPCAHGLAIRNEPQVTDEEKSDKPEKESNLTEHCRDPFEYFAQADGYSDGEKWWNDQIEERESSPELFTAILEAVTALREELDIPETDITLKREAWMRKQMRQAEKDGHQNIVVICGAWHAPALIDMPTISSDNALLTKIPKVKVAATWSPWTNSRLAITSGYGAGITSPGWYAHLWKNPKHPTIEWITRAARILRKQDLEGSSASIIEAVRLSDSLAGLRGRPKPGLEETMEAMQAIFCQGDGTLLQLLDKPLLINDRLGELPDGVAKLPLQLDIEAQQKSLRLKPSAGAKLVTLDLRDESPRKRSAFLHRLIALDIPYGEKRESRNRGTFKEVWAVQWMPDFAISIIDASAHGNTVEIAATVKLSRFPTLPELSEITENLDLALLSDLPDAVNRLLSILQTAAATTHDTQELMKAMIPLCEIARYGDVRKTETSSVLKILDDLCTRICIELPNIVTGIDETAASSIADLMRKIHYSISLLELDEHLASYHESLNKIAEHSMAHSLVKGAVVRILSDSSKIIEDDLARHLSYALSAGEDPTAAAHWIEGFLNGGAAHLIHHPSLLGIIHHWLSSLTEEHFTNSLPLLRRTFGQFTLPEREQISNKIASGPSLPKPSTPVTLNQERAIPAIDKVAELLNLSSQQR